MQYIFIYIYYNVVKCKLFTSRKNAKFCNESFNVCKLHYFDADFICILDKNAAMCYYSKRVTLH